MTIRRLHVPMIEPEDVVRHLGEQEKHWKAGRSAHALANLWFSCNALPKSLQTIFDSQPVFRDAELIDAFLERQVDLGTAGRPSQTDLLAVIGLRDQIAIVAVEGKAGEPFGEFVNQWLEDGEGKHRRLSELCRTLNISDRDAMPLRYQLLHRAASAIYEAKRYRTKQAVMIIQSFARDEKSFANFAEFLRALGIEGEVKRGVLFGPINYKDIYFWAGWVDDNPPEGSDTLSYLDNLRNYADRLTQWCDRIRAWCDKRSAGRMATE